MPQNQTNHWDELRALHFPENYPTADASQRLHDEMLFQRACQVVLWAMPAMSVYAMKKGSEATFGAGSNVLVVWKDRLNPKTLVSTPNSDVIYAMGYIDLKQDGPTVIEVPPKQQGILDDFWQRPITDVGYVGPDQGEGGNYLLLPPDYAGETPTATTPSPRRPTMSSSSGAPLSRTAIRQNRWRSWSRPASIRWLKRRIPQRWSSPTGRA